MSQGPNGLLRESGHDAHPATLLDANRIADPDHDWGTFPAGNGQPLGIPKPRRKAPRGVAIWTRAADFATRRTWQALRSGAMRLAGPLILSPPAHPTSAIGALQAVAAGGDHLDGGPRPRERPLCRSGPRTPSAGSQLADIAA